MEKKPRARVENQKNGAGLNQQQASASNQAVAVIPARPQLTAEDRKAYDSEIVYMNGMAEAASQASNDYSKLGKEAGSIPILQKAVDNSRDAAFLYGMAKCLASQRDLGLPFYQGKATCKAAESPRSGS